MSLDVLLKLACFVSMSYRRLPLVGCFAVISIAFSAILIINRVWSGEGKRMLERLCFSVAYGDRLC